MRTRSKPIRLPVVDPMLHSVSTPECTIAGCICHDLEREQAIADLLSAASSHEPQQLQITPRFQSMLDRLLP
jgi:hypothetical protein